MREEYGMPKSDPPINLDGKVKLGVGTLVVFAAAIFTLAGVYGQLPSKNDLREVLGEHNTSSDAHPGISRGVSDLRTRLERIGARTDRVEERQTETHADIQYIRERVDYLTEQTLRQAVHNEALQQHNTPGRAKQASNTAVERYRSGMSPTQAEDSAL